ncbi:MAG: FecR domain-containing protein [Verrucomicrobiota bacterium]
MTILLIVIASAFTLLAGFFSYRFYVNKNRTFAQVLSISSTPAGNSIDSIREQERLGKTVINFHQGLLTLQFDNGALLTVEGPTRFALVDDKHVKLHYGKAVFMAPRTLWGFVVETPDAEVFNGGADFGVDVQKSGLTEVHVIKGVIRARGMWEQTISELTAGQALRMNGIRQRRDAIMVRPDHFRLL